MHARLFRHQGKEEGLREALGLYETLQRIAEAVHGLRNSHAAMAHRAIADVHLLLNEHGAPLRPTSNRIPRLRKEEVSFLASMPAA